MRKITDKDLEEAFEDKILNEAINRNLPVINCLSTTCTT